MTELVLQAVIAKRFPSFADSTTDCYKAPPPEESGGGVVVIGYMPSLEDDGGVAVEDAMPRSLAVFGARQIGFCKNSGMGITFFAKNYIQTEISVIKYCV